MALSSVYIFLYFSDVVIGFSVGEALTATERINTSILVCPQILQGVLERDVSVHASTQDNSAMGIDTAEREREREVYWLQFS